MEMQLYNSLTRKKETFKPLKEGFVGMYVCGPTVYSDVHLGNCRTFVSFDIIYRYLKYLGYQVRYVRNITDVGHLEGDADSGAEDKISKKARIEALEPMEVVQRYADGFHEMMRKFNVLPPSIEPRATGHIIEQIEMVKRILENGYGYVNNGSVYFDTLKLVDENGKYGMLSGRKVEELIAETRDNLKKQDEKRHPSDFAIWVKAAPSHLMKWPSPWSEGYPGWHLECSAMSTKYLGETFDIHGGGNDLKFPHHENEIAQNYGACGCSPARYWLHGNMLLMNGKKMSKSDGNSITPAELFSGASPHVTKGYSPMVVRFFMLQTHYRSTLDLTDEALFAAEKGYRRLMEALDALKNLEGSNQGGKSSLDEEIINLVQMVNKEMSDDFNTPKALARLFELVSIINGLKDGHLALNDVSSSTLQLLKETTGAFIFDIFGLQDETVDESGEGEAMLNGLMELLISMRQDARERKDWSTSDKIRDTLSELKLQLKDGKEGTTWSKI
ncbi:MAG: cysteine--tRNA ligase [Saprospiraceae bacterium]